MGYWWQRRPSYSAGARLQPPGNITSTQLTTAWGSNIIIPMKTTGTIGLARVVKITSSGTVKATTGSSGRPAIGVVVATGTTSQILIWGMVRVFSASGTLAKGVRVVATSGAMNTSRYKGGTVRALNTAIASTLQHGHCLGWTLSSAAASSGTSVATNKKVLVFFNPMGRVSTGV
jgi:hypothetical protein